MAAKEKIHKIQGLSQNPRYHYLLRCGEKDLRLGRHEREYRIACSGQGAVLKATIDDTNMFYSLGNVSASDFAWVQTFDGKGELHFEMHQAREVKKAKTHRMSEFSKVRFYHRILSQEFSFQPDVELLGRKDIDEIKSLTRAFYPGSSFVGRMLDQPYFGIRDKGKIVSTGGIIFLDEESRSCQVGSFFTHPDHRGKGHCAKIIQHLLATLFQRGISDARLEVYDHNRPACAGYEKFAFRVEKLGLETLIGPAS